MDDGVILAPTRWSLRRAVRIVNETSENCGCSNTRTRRSSGGSSGDLPFLGYWITEKGVALRLQLWTGSRPRGSSTCGFSVGIGVPGSTFRSTASRQVQATCMPDAAPVRKQASPGLIPQQRLFAVSTSSLRFRHVISGSLPGLSLPVTFGGCGQKPCS